MLLKEAIWNLSLPPPMVSVLRFSLARVLFGIVLCAAATAAIASGVGERQDVAR